MKAITLTILVLLLAFSCEKDKDPVFSGITETDESAIPIGSVDESDWKFDDIWNDREEQLFDANNFKSAESLNKEINNTSYGVSAILSSTAYPNPAISVFNFSLRSDADTILFVIVNNNYEVIHSEKQTGGIGLWAFNSADRQYFSANSIYRIYYKLEYINGTIKRGHGDIKITD